MFNKKNSFKSFALLLGQTGILRLQKEITCTNSSYVPQAIMLPPPLSNHPVQMHISSNNTCENYPQQQVPWAALQGEENITAGTAFSQVFQPHKFCGLTSK